MGHPPVVSVAIVSTPGADRVASDVASMSNQFRPFYTTVAAAGKKAGRIADREDEDDGPAPSCGTLRVDAQGRHALA
jgi:hypothetical protein